MANDIMESRLRELLASLQLSAEQQNRLTGIVADYQRQETAIRQDISLLPQERQEKLRDAAAETRGQLDALLTAEQRVTLALELAAGPARTAQQVVTWLCEQATIEDDQKAELLRIIESQQKQAQTVRLDTALLAADKRDRLLRIRRETYRLVVGVLTADQQHQLRNAPALLRDTPLFPGVPF